MSSNPATLAASRAMLSRNSSIQSNLSAAAAATALKCAPKHTTPQQDHSLQRRPSSSDIGITTPASPRPGSHRRTSSMSERSFRAQAPEDHARERRNRPASLMDVTPEKTVDSKPNRRGSFTLPMSLRLTSSQKKQKQVAPGVIQPLLQQKTISATPSSGGQPRKLRTSMRGDREHLRERERDRPISPATHSAMRLPHNPGIGSAASSIRSFQTDLSSIVEDQVLGDNSHVSPKFPSHLFPMKSAMKGGSGPPSIISEAVTEESGSSLGAHDSHKQKVRVSFSDEQERNQVVDAVSGVGKGTMDGFLRPRNAAIMGRTLSPPASPPVSREVSPQVPTIIPPMLTPPATQSVPVKKEVVFIEKHKPVERPTELQMKGIKSNRSTSILAPLQSKTIANKVQNAPQVTIHVSPAKSLPSKTRLPGSFPDPTPEPTPPSTAESDIADAREVTDTLSPLPVTKLNAATLAEPNNDLDPQQSLSLRTLALPPTRLGVTMLTTPSGGENMVRLVSNESQASVYSDALDDLTSEQEEATRKTKVKHQKDEQVNRSKATEAAVVAAIPTAAVIATTTTTKPTSPKTPAKAKRATSTPPATKTIAYPSASKLIGTNIPTKTTMRSSLRENGITATRTTLRSSSVPPTSPRGRKPMRMSLRENDRATTASSADMARGLMSLPQIERVPSDSSFKRMRPREQSFNRITLRSPPKQEQPRRLSRDSDSSSEIWVLNQSSSIFGRFKRKETMDRPAQVTAESRFQDSSDEDDELGPPRQEVGRAYGDTESLPPTSPTFRIRESFSHFFARGTSRGSDVVPPPEIQPGATTTEVAADGGHGRSKSGSIISKRTGKEKRFQGLRKLFRIKE